MNSQSGASFARSATANVVGERYSTIADWAAYEAAKQVWIDANPGATPRQYEAAIERIAAQYGV